MRIGVLTAGGDCPGLNAVIRSVVHRAVAGHGDEVIGFEDGFKGLLDGRYRPLDLDAVSGILARGGTILGSARLERDRLREAARERRGAAPASYGIDALIPIGGEGTLTAARMLSDAGHAGRRRPQDHRQRHLLHRPHLRLRHRRRRRHRGHRPPEDHRRVAPARDGRRGHGPARRLDRPGVRHGRRRARHLPARAALRGRRPGQDGRGALRARQEVRGHLRRRGRAPGRGHAWTYEQGRDRPVRPRALRRHRQPAWPSSWSAGSARRPARSSSATSSAAAPPPRTTAYSPPASAGTRWRPRTAATSAG